MCACVWIYVNARECARILVCMELGCLRRVGGRERETLSPNPPDYLRTEKNIEDEPANRGWELGELLEAGLT